MANKEEVADLEDVNVVQTIMRRREACIVKLDKRLSKYKLMEVNELNPNELERKLTELRSLTTSHQLLRDRRGELEEVLDDEVDAADDAIHDRHLALVDGFQALMHEVNQGDCLITRIRALLSVGDLSTERAGRSCCSRLTSSESHWKLGTVSTP